jgi:hypothetical protein
MIRRGIGVQSFAAVAGGYTPSDADALAFVNAAEITNDTQKQAINTLVTDLKGYGIWTKMKAIYPFVGGTSSTHKFNLKDPRDLDAAFRLVFSGGWTHSSNGALPNGTNGYADTKLNINTQTTFNNAHVSYYSRTQNEKSGSTSIGCTDTSSNDFRLIIRRPTNTGFLLTTDNTNGVLDFTNTSSQGLFIGNANGVNVRKFFRNGISLAPLSANPRGTTIYPSLNVYIGSRNNNNTAGDFEDKECAFASIGNGLTDTEAANLYTAVQAYQTSLSRNV